MTKLFVYLPALTLTSAAWGAAPTDAPPVRTFAAPASAPAPVAKGIKDAKDTKATKDTKDPKSAKPEAADAAAEPAAETPSNTPPSTPPFAQLGFAPALYAVHYRHNVLSDSKDVRLRGDGTLSASGSRLATYMGVEVHYGFSTYNVARRGPNNEILSTRGHTFSPFVGLFDIDSGINGIALGAMYSYWNGDAEYKKTSAMNIGLGWTLHKNRLVLSDAVREGQAPGAGLTSDDYTQRKDVKGLTLVVSASFGF